jgi:hypothetical protein
MRSCSTGPYFSRSVLHNSKSTVTGGSLADKYPYGWSPHSILFGKESDSKGLRSAAFRPEKGVVCFEELTMLRIIGCINPTARIRTEQEELPRLQLVHLMNNSSREKESRSSSILQRTASPCPRRRIRNRSDICAYSPIQTDKS